MWPITIGNTAVCGVLAVSGSAMADYSSQPSTTSIPGLFQHTIQTAKVQPATSGQPFQIKRSVPRKCHRCSRKDAPAQVH